LRHAKFYPAICSDCGLTRFFTDETARSKLSTASRWKRL
jgi:predicted nucleic-acid-binding Zn-ribbon protein